MADGRFFIIFILAGVDSAFILSLELFPHRLDALGWRRFAAQVLQRLEANVTG